MRLFFNLALPLCGIGVITAAVPQILAPVALGSLVAAVPVALLLQRREGPQRLFMEAAPEARPEAPAKALAFTAPDIAAAVSVGMAFGFVLAANLDHLLHALHKIAALLA